MKINRRSAASFRTRILFARGLACLLLVGIVYTATFDAAHSHRNILSRFAPNVSANAVVQTDVLSASISPGGPIRGAADADECLICLLHRQFSNGTVHAPLFVVKHSAEIALVSAPAFFHYSSTPVTRPIARQAGRAPPTNRG
jgi:hypothetical protein